MSIRSLIMSKRKKEKTTLDITFCLLKKTATLQNFLIFRSQISTILLGTHTYGDDNSKMLARPTSVTAPNGTVTTTSYDVHNRVVQTNVDGEATLVYNYSNGYLSSIVRTDSNNNTQTYTLNNNEYGLTTAIKVGNRILASYQYQGGIWSAAYPDRRQRWNRNLCL